MKLMDYTHFYLVGIKGVAMTALAQCLVDAGKQVRGCDVTESFVTQPILDRLPIQIDDGFMHEIPTETECVIYTAAHGAQQNPVVIAATKRQLPLFSHAAALGELFNQQKGIAVCGVGGKSTTSAMITWILWHALAKKVSFAVGVGNIPGIEKTGQFINDAEYFVAEADEYVVDPSAPSHGEKIIPRFSFMHPFITVCTNLAFDHPDVYQNFDHTKQIYAEFFSQIKSDGTLVINGDDAPLCQLATQNQITKKTFGKNTDCDLRISDYASAAGQTTANILYQQKQYTLTLQIPGEFNLMNAAAAVLACAVAGIDLGTGCEALKSFRSTIRRSEYIGEKNGVKFYDDYAHHPIEVAKIIQAFREWYPQQRLVIAFQSHTFSRTKTLFNDFVMAFGQASEVAMIDIFPSARETFDPSVTSDLLCAAIQKQFPQIPAHNYHTREALTEHLQHTLQPGDVCITVGAGDIYLVHQLL